ncbi:MAG: type IV secretion system DNA-binding domain-containing protein [Clostridia bacterium]
MRLYFLVDKNYILSKDGEKLRRYITKNDLQNIAGSLSKHNYNHNNSLINKFENIKSSPYIYIKIKNTFILYILSMFLKVSFSYKFITTNFLYINIFNKSIDLSSSFGEYFYLFKGMYYVLFSFYSINIIYYFLSYYYIGKQKKDKELLDENNKKLEACGMNISLGKDIKNNLEVILNEKGLYQNILITGSIGSGKTSSAISNILQGLLQNKIYGVIIDVKGNFIDTVKRIRDSTCKSMDILEISLEGNVLYNPLNRPDISAIEIASRIKKVLTLLSTENTSDSFWLDKAESYIRDFIVLIRAYNSYVNFYELHKLVIDKEYLYLKLEEIKKKVVQNKYLEEELFELTTSIDNIKKEYLKLDERTLGIIKAEITRVTGVFVSNKKICDKFCSKTEEINFFSKKIIVLSMDISKNANLSKIIATYLKLDFQKQVLSNNLKSNPIFFLCDEYQIISNAEDASFFSLSREYRCINILSIQSYTSLFCALKKETTANVIIQSMVNKICFRQDDIYTVTKIINYVGKELKESGTLSFSETSQNSKYKVISNEFRNYKSGLSKSYSTTNRFDYILNEKYFTQDLKTFEALCIISNGEEIKVYEKVYIKRWEGQKNERKEIKKESVEVSKESNNDNSVINIYGS